MAEHSAKPTQGGLDRLTRKWWVLGLLLAMNWIPPFVTRYPQDEEHFEVLPETYAVLFSRALFSSLSSPLWGAFQVLPIALVVGIIFLGDRVSRAFSAYAAITFVLFAVLQNVAIDTPRFGHGVVTCNLLWFFLVASLWAWEAFAGRNDLSRRRVPLWRCWVVPLAVFAFWVPVAPDSEGAIRFTPLLFWRFHTGLAFCLMTPVYLAVLTLFWPRVNLAVMRVTAFVGIIIALWNQVTAFVWMDNWFHGVLHLPLTVISLYAFVLSFVRPRGALEAAPAEEAAR
jgi:hypothetical protein